MKSVVDKFENYRDNAGQKSDKSNELMITEFRQQLKSMSVPAKENVMVSLDDAINCMITVLVKGDL